MNWEWLGNDYNYQAGLDLQFSRLQARQNGEISDLMLLLEHSPVYTIGRTRDTSSLRDASHLPFPVFETNRGGQATYHGPGQLVGYPIVDLTAYNKDLHFFLRAIETALINVCADYNVKAHQAEGLTGVWVENRKIASIGLGIKKWVTMHGFAINLNPESLKGFQFITPCGISGVQMTCLENEMPNPRRIDPQQFGIQVTEALSAILVDLAQKS